MEFVHLQNQDEHRHRYVLFDLFDRDQKFYRYLMKYRDQHGCELYVNLQQVVIHEVSLFFLLFCKMLALVPEKRCLWYKLAYTYI